MRISGDGGRLRVGYQTAAKIGRWHLTRVRSTPEPAYEATAALMDVDAFWVGQQPLALELTVGNRSWNWSGIDPRITRTESLAVTLEGGPSIH
jgi:hypothetical protein